MGRKSKKRTPHGKQNTAVSLTPDKSTKVLRTHKDNLFRFIFRDRKNLLQLYNALNNSSYTDPDCLEITTLQDVLYVGYKNDVSFLLDAVLFLAEHQSSWNPNMPLRGVLYFSRLYQEYIRKAGGNMYGTKLVKLPHPQYVVFYNGTEPRPERELLKLSHSFQTPAQPSALIMPEPSLECTALVLNINYGNNREIMEKCRLLMDYSCFIHYTREYLAQGHTPAKSVDLAVERCLSENIMTDILRVHRKEVTTMFLTEFDEEAYKKAMKSEGYEEGHEDGQEEYNCLVKALMENNRMDDLKHAIDDKAFRQQLFHEFHIGK